MTRDEMKVLGRIEPQPPRGIKFMLGDEPWIKDASQRSPRRLHCEEWGAIGPMEMNQEIKPNVAGFRVRTTERLAPAGARGFTEIDGVYFWTDRDYLDEREGGNQASVALWKMLTGGARSGMGRRASRAWMGSDAHTQDRPEYRRYDAARAALLAWSPAPAAPTEPTR